MSKYWKQRYEQYAQKTDDTPEMDSQNSKDHGCQPDDPGVGTSWSPPKGK